MFYYASNLSLGNGYKMQWNPFQTAYLASPTAIVVEPTVLSIDFSTDKHTIVGLRIESNHFTCGENEELFTQYSDENSFFIVNTLTNNRIEFSSQTAFVEKLAELDLADKFFMDFEAFYSVGKSLRDDQPADDQLINCQPFEVVYDQ